MDLEKTDAERAWLFLFIVNRGLPPWAEGDKSPRALAILAGWTEEHAREALDAACAVGWAAKKT